jgi:hypothetical protein
MTVPFATNMKLVAELMYYDGALLAHYSGDDKQYIIAWTDVDDDTHHWLAMEVTSNDLQKYMDKRISLLDVMQRSDAIYACDGEFINAAGEAFGTLTAYRDLQHCLPSSDSYLQ